MDSVMGMKIFESPFVPVSQPILTFDPQHKCVWATREYRDQVDAWLVKRFGTEPVIYHLGNALVTLPLNAEGIRQLLWAKAKAWPANGTPSAPMR